MPASVQATFAFRQPSHFRRSPFVAVEGRQGSLRRRHLAHSVDNSPWSTFGLAEVDWTLEDIVFYDEKQELTFEKLLGDRGKIKFFDVWGKDFWLKRPRLLCPGNCHTTENSRRSLSAPITKISNTQL